MRATHTLLMSSIVLVAIASSADAQGNGKALGKALRKSGTSLKSSSLHRAGRNLAKTKSLSRSSKALAKSSRQLGRAAHAARQAKLNATTPRTVGLPNALERQQHNAQRTLDHRLAEADRLRLAAAETGNQELITQADLIDAQARQQFDRRTAQIDEFQLRHNLGPIVGPDVPVVDPSVPIDTPTVPTGDVTPIANPTLPDGGANSGATAPVMVEPATTPTVLRPQRKPSFSERMRQYFPFLSGE
jgi:hypothetical protein